MELMQGLFEDKLVLDDRTALATFSLPWFGADAVQWEILSPKWMLWQQLVYLLILQIAFQCFFAAINFYLIVKQRRTLAAYLIGWGIVVPITILFPYQLLEHLDVQSKVIKLSAATTTFIVGFRTIEAMYDTSPHSVEASIHNYLIYYTSLLHFDWDPKTNTRRKITANELLRCFATVILFSLLCSIVLSFEIYHDFRPFPSPVKLEDFHFNLDLITPAHLGNAYILTVLTYLTLSFGFEFTAFGDQAKGYSTKPVFSNPLFSSKSPSDFWGQKWNMMVHNMLKYGVFLPARQFVSVPLAVLCTFVMSGLVHDYAWSIIFYQHSSRAAIAADGSCGADCYEPFFLKLTAFFLWNGVVMLLERPLSKYFRFARSLPRAVVSTMVILTALPVSHWYTGDWVMGGYFRDLSIGMWQIRPVVV